MPQFDPSVFSPQLFWLVVTFIALYWLVSKVAVPRVGEVLDQRARVMVKIENGRWKYQEVK